MEAPIVPPRAMEVTDTAIDADTATATVAAIVVVMATWLAWMDGVMLRKRRLTGTATSKVAVVAAMESSLGLAAG